MSGPRGSSSNSRIGRSGAPAALALAALAAAALALVPARAAAYDPGLRWHTIETAHFEIHYHDGLAALAQRAARAAEAAHERLVPLLGHAPGRRVDIVISDDVDAANGSAGAFLRPEIHLYAATPESRSELNDYEDYLWNLITHEYTHVLHHDQVGGVPAWFDRVFGQLWVPNAIQPRWFVEGLAVWSESQLSGGGRDRSSLYDMFLRAEVLDGHFFGLDDAGGAPSSYPRGAIAYLHGARFLDWVVRARDPAVLPRISEDYGSQLVPFGVNLTARSVLGSDWVSLYESWRQAVTDEVSALAARLREQGLTPMTRLTQAGEGTGEPRFAADGRILYLEASGDRRAALRAVDPATGRDAPIAELYGAGSVAAAPNARWAVVSQVMPYRNYYSYFDLYRVDLATGSLEALTHGARADEPDVAPDGKSVVAVQHPGAGRSAIAVLSLDRGTAGTSTLRTLYQPPEGCIVFTPRYAPDGTSIAFSEQCPSGRDIRRIDLETRVITDVTRDRALDLDPAFDPSGRYLLFASDRTGIYNLYARDLSTGETWQVTNALTGAFQPSVSADGTRLAFVTYSSTGYDVALMPFEPAAWKPAPEVDLVRSIENRPPALDAGPSVPERRYSALPTLRPYWWLPVVQSAPAGFELGATTGGSDVIGLHDWSLTATWGIDSKGLGLDATYGTRVFRPEFGFAAASHLFPIAHAQNGELERQSQIGATATWPFAWKDRGVTLGVGYRLRYFDPPAIAVPRAPDEPLPLRVDRGLAAIASATASFSNAHGYANSISPERGFTASVGVQGAAPETGSQFSFGAVQGSASTYLGLPWLAQHHVLALALSGGVSVGEVGRRPVFSLGGIGIHDPVMDVLNATGAYGPALRGYAPAALSGSRFVLANAEYRFPLLAADTGLWTLPFYVSRIHAAITADAGAAADRLTFAGLRSSVGVEIRTELLLGYQLGTELRLGFARGLAADGINEFFLGLGSSF